MDTQTSVSTRSGQAIRIAGPKSPFSIQQVDYPSPQGDQDPFEGSHLWYLSQRQHGCGRYLPGA